MGEATSTKDHVFQQPYSMKLAFQVVSQGLEEKGSGGVGQ
jgi:hypothetical protein